MADVSSNRLMTFLQDCPVRTFNKGEIIIFQGEAPRAAYVVKSGVVKAYNLSVNGSRDFSGIMGLWEDAKCGVLL
jgi:CRP-like cAMP-binding protein